jgi:hypothetical protein
MGFSFQVKLSTLPIQKENQLLWKQSLNIIIIIWLHQEIKSSDLIWLTSMLVFVQKAMTDFEHNFFHIFNLTYISTANPNLTLTLT